MQSHQDWHGRTNPSAGHTGQGHQAAYATDQTRQGHPPANVYDSYYTREGRDSSRSRRDQRSPRRHSRDRSSHGRHRDSRRRSRERRHSRSPRRKERRHESDRDRGTPSSRGTDSQHSRSSTDQAPRPPLPPPPPTDNYIPPLLPPTASMPHQGRPLPRRSRASAATTKEPPPPMRTSLAGAPSGNRQTSLRKLPSGQRRGRSYPKTWPNGYNSVPQYSITSSYSLTARTASETTKASMHSSPPWTHS